MKGGGIMKVAIDDGHGSETQGKRTPIFPDGSIMKENEFNRAVADYLERELKEQGFSPVQVAPENYDVPLNIRAQRANQYGAGLYISIHANAAGSGWGTANGIETYIHPNADGETLRLANCIHKELITATGRKDRGVKRSDFYVLRKTQMPAVLMECGFMTNIEEALLLKSDDYRRKCAEAICRGVCKFAGTEYKEAEEMPVNVEVSKIVLNGEDKKVRRILHEGTNYINLRDLATALGYSISNNGSIAVLTKK